jgi:hypothetical protein
MALNDWLSNNSGALLAASAGLLGGRTGNEQAAGGLAGFGNAMAERKQQNKTLEFLRKMNPEIAAAVEAGAMSPLDGYKTHVQAQAPMKPLEVNGRLVDPKTYQVLADFSTKPEGPQPTDDMREYEFAKTQGYNKNFSDWQLENRRAGATNVNTGAVQLPAEMGARIGLGDQFSAELPGIKKQITGGAIDGPIERGQLAAGVGTPAQIWRRIETGKEALVRNLTGAGMAQAEAENQAARYQINALDTTETMIQKLEGLERDLQATRSGAIGARTGDLSIGPQSEKPVPGAVVDYTDYFK